jgi:pimeloyl-ACP methyl ester carboxylesterase
MDKVENIKLPTLILCGDQDQMTPKKYSDYLSDKIDGSEKRVIDDAQHFAQLQNYKQVHAHIEEFVNSIK